MDEIHAQHPDPKQDKLISRAKVAAFTAKWLLKYMPIYIFPKPGYKPTEDEKIKMFHANESFALDHSTSLMGREAHLLPTETIEDILYHFKYRSSDDRSLILAFSLLSRS
jgi:hypothetical protein